MKKPGLQKTAASNHKINGIHFSSFFDPGQVIWALLHGTCLGGNITLIGSTANIVALGMLEKRYHHHIHFFEWFRVGIVVGLISCLIAWGCIALLSPYMPTKAQRMGEPEVPVQIMEIVPDKEVTYVDVEKVTS